MFSLSLLAILAATTSALSIPFTKNHGPSLTPRSGSTAPNPVSQLLTIAPTSNTCLNASFPSECVVSSMSIVQAMVDSFAAYNITTAAEQAALLSWMAFESGDFKFNRNHFPAPGRPGQGTRVMLMPNFVSEYAASIPELKTGLTAAGSDVDKILSLVLADKYSFASAAWYYGTHCSAEQKEQVKNGGKSGWETAFVTGCVGTTVTDDRTEYWVRARSALGVTVD
ncbi:hypothetical protein HRR83_001098 [Exophiala dermatitidis]|uniref:Lysozyme n=2 Tax=Exophiala dermatitidis TaxID=5970 RepID=H6C7D4_EXODN|nr:uncharacterized protein HMPREF1120_07615 [Exophiala dermatitidis NIH/UT8656]KAJ4525909.1 hypothetical protein HRR74_001102 [Exophiala dermatitidis]EHY59630.1 hypothetical protein HMPREF1120_07615 [Exophiala dermatitidis NIH/UT8656]KAJ4527144.1 hypothetical protein HRR73_001941 [Exophiala dermatitidis]KAJ4532865.1 hypothetical protein HRR76_007842 [Exophiala dermatitidis]KAJ4538866.1 hypothetical protein HRR77_006789 [Exophiala dermatitidis]